MFNKILGKFSKDLGIDLGTSSTVVYVKDKGIIINEPSIVAVNNRTNQILAVGEDAKKMLGRTPEHIVASHPLVEGVISDFEVTEKMFKYFIDRVYQENFTILLRPRIVVGIPLDVTEVERKAVEDAALSAGAREVFLVESVIAAALGARLPIWDASASMIIDIGGGTVEIAVISLGGVVTWKSLRTAGDVLNRNVIQYIRDQFNLLVGDITAEEIKIKIGAAEELKEPLEMKVRGRDLISGLPREITISSSEIHGAIHRTLKLILDNIKATLEITPPELVGDIYKKGLILTGGGALLRQFKEMISNYLQIPVQITDDPLTNVARGTGIIIEDLETFREIIIPSTQEKNIIR